MKKKKVHACSLSHILTAAISLHLHAALAYTMDKFTTRHNTFFNDNIFVLLNQNGDLVRHISFEKEKNIMQLCKESK